MAVLLAGAVAMAALVVLACRLPCHSEPGGDLRPPDALIDGMVDEHRQFCLRLVPHVPDVPDLLKHLGCRRVSDLLRRACGFCCRLLRPPRLHVLHPRTRPALRLAHGFQDAAQL